MATMMNLLRKPLLRGFVAFTVVCVAACLQAASAAAEAARKPNIVLILADDLGYGDVGYYGSSYKTPQLDALANVGVRLDCHYVFPACSPTRAALLTGRYASRFGCTSPQNKRVLPFDTVTLASALKSAGYHTALTGKWHLGSRPEWGPNKFGFDHGYGLLAGSCGPYDHRYKTGPYTKTWHRNGSFFEEEGHVTDLITREAVRVIKTKRERPFFLYVPFTAVHLPIDEPQKWLDANKNIPDFGERLRAADATHLDDCIRQIVEALEQQNLRENTLLIFLSDNGAHGPIPNNEPGYPAKYPAVQTGGSNAPFRGGKWSLYEGGIRTPAIVSWPGRLQPGKIDAPLHVTDWMPTLCALAGYKPEKDLKWDGRDIWPMLTGQVAAPETRTLYWLGPGRESSAVRQGDWKLVVSKGDNEELFNLADDPGEKKNLAAQLPNRVAELKKLMMQQAARDNDAAVKEKPATAKAKKHEH
jgi:arylsulfatase A-like enzyme